MIAVSVKDYRRSEDCETSFALCATLRALGSRLSFHDDQQARELIIICSCCLMNLGSCARQKINSLNISLVCLLANVNLLIDRRREIFFSTGIKATLIVDRCRLDWRFRQRRQVGVWTRHGSFRDVDNFVAMFRSTLLAVISTSVLLRGAT